MSINSTVLYIRMITFSALLGVAILLLAGCGNNTAQKVSDTIVVGMLPADPPFMSINASGEYEGFDVDVAHAIGNLLGKKIAIEDMGVGELFIALERGRIDMMMCGLSITARREQRFNMIHYHGEGITTYPLVFWKEIPENISSMQDLVNRNFTIGVLPATTQEEFAQQFDFITLKSMNSYADIIMDLQFSKIQAALFDEAIAGFANKFPELRIVNVPIGNFSERGNGIALQKNATELTSQVQSAVQQLKENGTMARLAQKWNMGE